MNKYLDISPEVQQALADGKPVVALESTIISHGMPYPKNVETAMLVEKTIRENGAVPATIAIIGGRLKAGLSHEEIEYLGKSGRKVAKVSRRDLAAIVARGADGATTVTTTMIIAHMAGIKVFATGGIGGVHRGAQETFDISADLEELANTSVMVICAGAKSILDLGLTLEYLETHGVTVIGYGTSELPAFYTRSSGFGVDYRVDTPAQLAAMFKAQQELGMKGGMLVTNPIPEQYSMDADVINKAIDEAVEEAKEQGIHGKATTPFLLAKIKDITGGDSLAANIQLVYNNAKLAADTACELAKLRKIIDRECPDSSCETLLVLDATTGQNAVNQAKDFKDAAGITGIVLTKLDGTARGGVVLAINNELDVPVKFVGVGEQIDDLQPFDADAFAAGLFDKAPTEVDEEEIASFIGSAEAAADEKAEKGSQN